MQSQLVNQLQINIQIQNPKSKNKLLKIFPSQVEDQTIQPRKNSKSKVKKINCRNFPSQVEDQTIQPGKNSKSKVKK